MGAGAFASKVSVATAGLLFSQFVKDRDLHCRGVPVASCVHDFALQWVREHPSYVPATYIEYSSVTFGLSDAERKQVPFPVDAFEKFKVRVEFDTNALIEELNLLIAGTTVGISISLIVNFITFISKLSRMELLFYKPPNSFQRTIINYILNKDNLGPLRKLPSNATNAITFNNIKKGNQMVNFKRNEKRLESNLNQYYKQSTYSQFELNDDGFPKHPITRAPIENVYEYTVA